MIGQIKETTNPETGEYIIAGEISTYTVCAPIRLDVADGRRTNDSPTHNVLMKSPVTGKYFHAGVAWKGHHAQHGNYFSINLEVPEIFNKPVSLIAGEAAPGLYTLRYAKEKAQQQSQAAA